MSKRRRILLQGLGVHVMCGLSNCYLLSNLMLGCDECHAFVCMQNYDFLWHLFAASRDCCSMSHG